MPLYNFIKVLTTDNLKWLLSDKDGWRLKPDLDEVWERIFMDYTERKKDPNSQQTFEIIKTIRTLEYKIKIAKASIELLAKVDDLSEFKPTISALKSETNYYGAFTKQSLAKDLKQCLARLKLMIARHSEAYEEYKSISQDDQAKAKESDFTEQIVVLEQTFGFFIETRKISVAKYISYLSDYKMKAENGGHQ